MLLKSESLSVSYEKSSVLQDVHFQVEQGEFVAVIGENGAGKSTLLKAISGEITDYSGGITFDGNPLSDYSITALSKMRAVMSQSIHFQYGFTVEEVILFGRAPHDERRSKSLRVTREMMSILNICHLQGKLITELSGGERQRVFLAKSLAQIWDYDGLYGKLLLLDEPTSALDLKHQKEALFEIKQLTNAGLGVICITHDMNLVTAFADKALMLANGHGMAFGPTRTVMNEANILQCFGVKTKVVNIEGIAHPVVVNAA